MKKKIIVVSPTVERNKLGTTTSTKLRVAAYCRVSSESDEQLNSLAVQKKYFEELLNAHENYENAGIYFDEGITGTGINKRAGFNKMVEDALNEKIDLIIVKSISRFARNTVDALKTIRALKEKGVRIIFEKENLDTLDTKSEFILTIMSSLAQEESQSISENVKWSIRKGFAEGKVSYPNLYGYKYESKYKFVVDKEEAKVICLIYKMFLEGTPKGSITKYLNKYKIGMNEGKKKWNTRNIISILANEKYSGDAILQKTYVPNYITHRLVKNNGELTKYIVKNNHEPIIPKATWELTQDVDASRPNGLLQNKEFSLMIKCSICGGYYEIKTMYRDYFVNSFKYYQCEHKQRKGKFCKKSVDITELQLESLFHEMTLKLYDIYKEVVNDLCLISEKVIRNKRKRNSINNRIRRKPEFQISDYEKTTWKVIVSYATISASTLIFHLINGDELKVMYTKWRPSEYFKRK